MNKLLIPTFYAKNLFDIDVNFFTLLNIKYIFADLDNTLDSYKEEVASKRVIEYVTLLKKNEINLIIVSNNSNKRVEKYAHSINIPYLYKCYKPFTKKINKYINNNKINKENCIMIGDQVLTDIRCGNKLKIKTILVDDLVNSNQLVTKFNKFMAKNTLKKLKSRNMLVNWRDVYVRIQESR